MTDATIDTTVAVEAPEQICFHYRLAGPAQRAVAHLIDLGVLALAVFVTWFATGLITIPLAEWVNGSEGVAKVRVGLLLVVLFFAQWGYFTLFEALGRGQTPGKRALGLRVIKTGGEPAGFADAALRNLLRTADLLPFGYAVGLCVQLADPRFRRLGDWVAGTMVVAEDRLSVAKPLRVSRPTAAEIETLGPRVDLAPDELRAIETFLRRAPGLGSALSAELAGSVAAALGNKYGVSHDDPVRLMELLYLGATAPLLTRSGPDTRSPSVMGRPRASR